MQKKFLIGQLASYGDCLYATTIAKQIKHDHPGSHVTWAVSARYSSILKLNPHVDAIWEIPQTYGDVFTGGWNRFRKEALQKKSRGEFDTLIFSQIAPRWVQFNGTIRNTILSAYEKPITVSRQPVIQLSSEEVEHVRQYSVKNGLTNYRKVVLFECSPTSGQSKNVNVEFALRVAKNITNERKDICFILSSPNKIETGTPQILDASELTFRENAELTKYCDLLIGCSSGITWLATSEWAKPLQMIQLLDESFALFYGVRYDHELNGLPYGNILEMLTFSEKSIVDCITLTLDDRFEEAKKNYNEEYKVTYENFQSMVVLLLKYGHLFATIPMLLRYNNKYGHLSLIGLLFSLVGAHILFLRLAIKKAGKYLSAKLHFSKSS